MDVFSGVRLFVSFFVCQHNNFRMIKRRMMKLGGYVHCTKISPEFECQGQRSRSPGTKTKKCSILFRNRPLLHGPRAAFFPEPSSWALLRRWENQHMLSSVTISFSLLVRVRLSCVRFSFFSTMHSDWLGRTSRR